MRKNVKLAQTKRQFDFAFDDVGRIGALCRHDCTNSQLPRSEAVLAPRAPFSCCEVTLTFLGDFRIGKLNSFTCSASSRELVVR